MTLAPAWKPVPAMPTGVPPVRRAGGRADAGDIEGRGGQDEPEDRAAVREPAARCRSPERTVGGEDEAGVSVGAVGRGKPWSVVRLPEKSILKMVPALLAPP